MLSVLLLAAGASSRMRGGDKLLEIVDGAPLIRTLAKRVLRVFDNVIVALPPEQSERSTAIEDLPLTQVKVADANLGMAHSLRSGIAALNPKSTGVIIVPADMPELTKEDMHTFAQRHEQSPLKILRGASSDGQPGHPVLFPSSCFPDLGKISGDTGAREVIKNNAHLVELIRLPGNHALTDLDTPEQWDSWRAAQGTAKVT